VKTADFDEIKKIFSKIQKNSKLALAKRQQFLTTKVNGKQAKCYKNTKKQISTKLFFQKI